jgi:hypothetical protein
MDAMASRGQYAPLLYRWRLLRSPVGARGLDSTQPVTTYLAERGGRYGFGLSLSDTRSTVVTAGFEFTVANVPPRADAGPQTQLILPDPLDRVPVAQTDTSLRLDGRGSRDGNGDSLAYSWEVVAWPPTSNFVAERDLLEPRGARPTLVLDPATDNQGQLLAAGDYVVRLTVTDPLGESDSATTLVHVIDPNSLVPSADAGLSRNVKVTVRSAAPLALASDIQDPLDESGHTPVDFIRLDGRESADPNVPPLPLTYGWSVLAAPEGSSVRALTKATDPFPSFVPDRPGNYRFGLVVDNGRFSSSQSSVDVLVAFRTLNGAPKADASVEDRARGLSSRSSGAELVFVAEVDRVELDGTMSSDPDPGDALTYAWEQTGGPQAVLSPSGTGPLAWFVPTRAGRYSFRLHVADAAGLSNTGPEFSLTARAAGDTPPKLSVTASSPTTNATGEDFEPDDLAARPRSLRVRIGQEVILRAQATDPDVGHPPLDQRLHISFHQVAGPTVLLTTAPLDSPLASEARFVPTTSRVHVFEVLARQLDRDGVDTGVRVARNIRVLVDSDTNGVPVARIALFTLKGPVSTCMAISLGGTPSRDEGPNPTPNLLYRWVQVNGPPVTMSNPFSPVLTFVAPDLDDKPRQYSFRLFVDDGRDRSEPDTVSLVAVPASQRSAELSLVPGPNLVSLPVDPGVFPPYRIADFIGSADAAYAVMLSRPADGSPPRFRVFFPGLSPASINGVISGGDGLMMARPGRLRRTTSLSGQRWPVACGSQPLVRGLNLVGYPRGLPTGETVEDLRQRSGANFVLDTYAGPSGSARFRIYIPGLNEPFPVEEGKAYLLSVPVPTTLTLPGCE